jgi:hypothetical protein
MQGAGGDLISDSVIHHSWPTQRRCTLSLAYWANGANRNPTGKSPQDVGQLLHMKIILFVGC